MCWRSAILFRETDFVFTVDSQIDHSAQTITAPSLTNFMASSLRQHFQFQLFLLGFSLSNIAPPFPFCQVPALHKLKENGWFLHGSTKKRSCGRFPSYPPQVILSRIMGFFYRIFLSRIIGAEGLGLYQMIFPILALALSVTSAGLTTAISHQVSRKNAHGDKRGIWNIFFAGAAFSLLLSFLAAGLLRSYAGVLAEVFLKDVRCEELLKYLALCHSFRTPFTLSSRAVSSAEKRQDFRLSPSFSSS